ncbi:MAG: response regulator, partial [Persicimonas sp.]
MSDSELAMNDSSTLGAELSFGDVDQVRRVLLIEDDEDDYLLTRDYFDDFEKSDQHTLEWVDEYDEGLKVLLEESHDVCLLDFRLGARDGLELLREAHEKGCRTPIILLTGAGSRRIDTSAMRHGAADYLVKDDLTPALLERSIRHAIERHRFSEAQRFLAATGVQLTSTLDYEETLEGLARLVVEHLADYCAIDLIDEDGRPTRLEVGVGPNGNEQMGAWLREHRFCENPECTAARAIDRGEAVLVHRIDEEFLGEASQT